MPFVHRARHVALYLRLMLLQNERSPVGGVLVQGGDGLPLPARARLHVRAQAAHPRALRRGELGELRAQLGHHQVVRLRGGNQEWRRLPVCWLGKVGVDSRC